MTIDALAVLAITLIMAAFAMLVFDALLKD
jgi:hypothetical protein